MCKFQRDCMELLTCDEKNGRCCSEKKGQPGAGRGVCHSACGCNRDCKEGFFCHTNEFTCIPLTKSGQEQPLTACPAMANTTGSGSGSGKGSGKGGGSGGNHLCCCDPLIPCGNPNDCLDDCVPSGSEGSRWHMGNYTWKFIPAPSSTSGESSPIAVPFKKTNNPDCNVGCMAEARGEGERCSRELQTATTHGMMDKARHCMDQAVRKCRKPCVTTGGEGCRAGVCSDGMCSCEELEKGGGEACAVGKVCASGMCDGGICTEDEHAKGEALLIGYLEAVIRL